jgi:glutathione S-transferase
MTKLTLCEFHAPDPDIGIETLSPFCLKVHRALRAASLGYERRFVASPAELRHLNPAQQVPVLLVGDEPVFDSTRIVARISELGRPLDAGLDARGRAEALLWEELADSAVNAFVVAARWADDRNWPAVREAYFGRMPALLRAFLPGRLRANVVAGLQARDVWRHGEAECWRRYDALLDQLELRAPASGFWIGERLSVADLALFGQLRSLRTPLTPRQSARLEARPALVAWLDRVDAATSTATAPLAVAA